MRSFGKLAFGLNVIHENVEAFAEIRELSFL